MKQKTVFLKSEGDAWFARNHDVISDRDYSKDRVVQSILDINSDFPIEGNAGGADPRSWMRRRQAFRVVTGKYKLSLLWS